MRSVFYLWYITGNLVEQLRETKVTLSALSNGVAFNTN